MIVGQGPTYTKLKNIIHGRKLHTVCEEALCPNMGRCWESGRATLMILGNRCTRSCAFCGAASLPRPVQRAYGHEVQTGWHGACDENEPHCVAEAVREMGLSNVVITWVTRDDLEDGGARIWAETIRCVREAVPGICVEVLVPDFRGSIRAFKTVMEAKPEILGHNLETVSSLYKRIRPQADYGQSLRLLKTANEYGFITKTSIMVGVGETADEVFDLMKDAIEAGCDIFYVGQYLQPTKEHVPVHRYVKPDEFEIYRERGLEMGFKVVVSGPLVRSSYHSEEQAEYVRSRPRRCRGEPRETRGKH